MKIKLIVEHFKKMREKSDDGNGQKGYRAE